MTFNVFLSAFALTKAKTGGPPAIHDRLAAKFIKSLPFGVYNRGLYALLNTSESAAATERISKVFPTAAGNVSAFAADWMGRVFALDATMPDETGSATVACFDLAEPSSFTTEANFIDFHNRTAVEMTAGLFNLNQFEEWTTSNQPPEDGSTCIGYKVPLFLNGPDSVNNMESTDRLIYWQIVSEMWLSISGTDGS